MRIAILDDGVNEGWLEADNIVNLQVDKENKIIPRINYDKYEKNHGSLCAGIIKKYAPDCEIVSIKVLDDNRLGSCRALLKAMDWCMENNIRLIHMSIGSTRYIDYEPLRKKTAQLISAHCIIVAACHNEKKYTLPACLSGVIGVKALKVWDNTEYRWNRYYYDDADVLAQSRHYINGAYTSAANSYAAPFITAKICRLIENNQMTISQIKQELYNSWIKTESTLKKYNVNLASGIDFIYRAYVIDYDNQLQYDLCEFEVERADIDELSFVKICNRVSVVIIGNSNINDTDVMRFLENNKKNIVGAAVCGRINAELKQFLYCQRDYFIWTTDISYIQDREQSTDIPIIAVRCLDRKKQLTAGKMIAKSFTEQGYGVLMVSDELYSSIYGYKYFEPEKLTDNLLNQYINRIEPDIVVASFEENHNIYSDMQIYSSQTESKQYNIYDGEKMIEWNISENQIFNSISNYLS